MSTLTAGGRDEQRLSALTASAVATAAGGAMDAWLYLAHGHVFATAQSANVVLMAIALAGGDIASAATHLPSFLAFVTGAFASRLSGHSLKLWNLNSRTVRLGLVCVMLAALALFADRMSDRAVTACIGFIAGVQVTSLSHIGPWSFNTSITTGNLLAGLNAFAKALTGSAKEWPHATAMLLLFWAFGAGAAAGGWLTPRLGAATLLPVAALIAAAMAAGPQGLDPIPDWSNLE